MCKILLTSSYNAPTAIQSFTRFFEEPSQKNCAYQETFVPLEYRPTPIEKYPSYASRPLGPPRSCSRLVTSNQKTSVTLSKESPAYGCTV